MTSGIDTVDTPTAAIQFELANGVLNFKSIHCSITVLNSISLAEAIRFFHANIYTTQFLSMIYAHTFSCRNSCRW